jgi:hypothetical protein
MNLHDAEQGRQPPATDILERAVRSTARATASAPAMLLRPRLDQMALQPRQDPFPLCYRQPKPNLNSECLILAPDRM